MNLPRPLGVLRRSPFSEEKLRTRRVKDELRENLMARLCNDVVMCPGIVGYDDTVVPQIVNAILSRHNFILLGLRGQAKSRILRALTSLLDAQMPYIAGCEIHDNPYAPICRRCRDLIAECGESTAIAYLTPEDRYVEKLAKPDVTIADLIGDMHPIKAARNGNALNVPKYVREVVERIAFAAREDKKVDKRSGVSQRLPISCMENVISNAERRAIHHQEKITVPRIGDIYAALPAITGKLELEYEGEMKGADNVAHDLIRAAIAKTFDGYFDGANMQQIVQWFDLGGEIKVSDTAAAAEVFSTLKSIQGLSEKLAALGVKTKDMVKVQVAAAESVLAGLYAQ